MKNLQKIVIMIILVFVTTFTYSQQVEVQGELKVTQMSPNDTQDNLVIHNPDGTLGTRSVASLPSPPPPIDTSRNLASDYELAKQLCNCPNLPPFLIKKLLESGYTTGDLIEAGIPDTSIINAIRFGSFIDLRDYQTYKTVTIGTQTWMAENLNFGTRIDGATDQMDNSIFEKYCYGDDPAKCTNYGGLYQWDEMMQYVTTPGTQGVCPTGWHLPTDNEWKTMEMHLGMTQAQADGTSYRGTDQGSQMADNDVLWNNGALNQNAAFGSSGFAALPTGRRYTSGAFFYQYRKAYFWSSSESGTFAWYRYLDYLDPRVNRQTLNKTYGFSVRCVRD